MKPELLFVTDPLCSWCWGTLPEILKAREDLSDAVNFNLIMGGLQIGPPEGLVEYDKKRLLKLWIEVAKTTGQTFSGRIPPNFIYHSELTCRAVELARIRKEAPPWDFFYNLQSAFYTDGQDINQVEFLSASLGIELKEMITLLHSDDLINITRANFDLAKSLSANALPSVFLNAGEGLKLVSGGYITAEFLVPEIQQRLGQI